MDIKGKHLSYEERMAIERMLSAGDSFKEIGRVLGRDCTTISKEVRGHRIFRKTGSVGSTFNDCASVPGCTASRLCPGCTRRGLCQNCRECTRVCPGYRKLTCPKLARPPYVCNACRVRSRCRLEKSLYHSAGAQTEYREVLSDCRQGVRITREEAGRIDSIVSPLLRKGQSPHHVWANHADELMVSERTLYGYLDMGMFSARNLDLPRKVRYRERKRKAGEPFRVDRACRQGRTYADYLAFMSENPGMPVVEMDSVEGRRGGKVLLTLHFVTAQLMLAFLRDSNTARSVADVFGRLHAALGEGLFTRLFPVLLGDNGSEFSSPADIEAGSGGLRRTRVFYCDPGAPHQKGAAENNHEMIRRVIPKGVSMDSLTQADVSLMMDHINSYGRKNLGDRSPYEVFALFYGEEVLGRLGVAPVPADGVTLLPSLLKK